MEGVVFWGDEGWELHQHVEMLMFLLMLSTLSRFFQFFVRFVGLVSAVLDSMLLPPPEALQTNISLVALSKCR